jgi:hypothetical protein
MLRINIEWSLLNLDNPPMIDKSIHLYVFEKNGEVKYIGYSNELQLIKEVSEYLRLFNIRAEDMKIWGGTIRSKDANPIVRDLIESVICLMVNQMKPQYNVLCKSAYYGYANISINNNNFPAMPKNFSIYNTFGYQMPGNALQI